MALPSSGQISFNDVRVETSQSIMTNYAISGWTWGLGQAFCGGYGTVYAPINVLSSGSRFSQSNKLTLSNLSMSAWYNYNHNASIDTGITGTLYQHADRNSQCYPTTMLPIELGTTNVTYSINVSGSDDGYFAIYYGKPWRSDGAPLASSVELVYVNSGIITASFNYNYTYNAASGSKIYCVLFGECP
jgi:hypothetical protein